MEENFCKKIKDYFNKNNINLSSNQIEQFSKYYYFLKTFNEKFNLTAITSEEEVIVKHFYDSIICFNKLKEKAKVIDIGCGAGFPSIPLKILRPDLEFVLVDSVNKKLNFINELILHLGLKGVTTVHSRAEDLAFDKNYREKFDYCVSRAVAKLNTLVEYCLPFVKINGKVLSYKSNNSQIEIEEAKNAIKILGGKINDIFYYKIVNYNSLLKQQISNLELKQNEKALNKNISQENDIILNQNINNKKQFNNEFNDKKVEAKNSINNQENNEDTYNRVIIEIEKLFSTSLKYPRKNNKPRTQPL